MSDVWLVTGTDTGVGKTVVTAALVAAARAGGLTPYVVKPAQTGVEPHEPGDLDEVRRLAGEVAGHEGVRLRAPLAPATAARLERITIPSAEAQADRIVTSAAHHDVVLVEGAGGVLVQLGEQWTLLDLADHLVRSGLRPVFVVVARAGLGTLNHAALTVDAVRRRRLAVGGVVVGRWPAEPDLAAEQNLLDLPAYTGVQVLGRVPEGAGSLPPEEFVDAAPGWLSLPPDDRCEVDPGA